MAFKILLVDDEPFMRNSIIRELRGLDMEIIEKENGSEALSEFLDQENLHKPFDLLITDNEMPKLKGLELIDNLQGHFPNLPIILLSGTLNVEDVPERVVFINKPWEHNKIKELVEQIIDRTK